MAKKSSTAANWLIGCGLGCGLVVALVAVMGVRGALWMRDTMSGFERAEESREALEERLGEPASFTPRPDGAVPPERMEVFLAVREATRPAREGIEGFFELIPLTEESARELEEKPFLQKMGSVFGITRAAVGLAGDIGQLYAARNEALERLGMGMGEYTYIYVLAYQSWLGHPPDDGPEEESGAGLGAGMGRSRARVQRELIAILGNQADAINSSGRADLEPLRARLEAEIEALEESRWRVPWEQGVPEPVARALDPFRARLEASYSPVANLFELGEPEQRGGFSVTVR